MLRVIFRSEVTSLLSYTDIQKICLTSARNNRKSNVTGYMVECGGVFVECLEGPPESVKSTMKMIESDRRHHNITTLFHHRTAHRRAFGAWSMNVMFLDDQLLWQRAIGSVQAYDRFLEYSLDPAFSIGVLARAYRHACVVLGVDPAARSASGAKIPRLKQMLRD